MAISYLGPDTLRLEILHVIIGTIKNRVSELNQSPKTDEIMALLEAADKHVSEVDELLQEQFRKEIGL